MAERPSFQRDLGQADLRLRAARALALEIHEEAWTTVCAGQALDPQLLAKMRASAVLATDVAVEVVTQAFRYGGGSALYSTNILQRCLRDIHAASQHLLMSNSAYENHGQFMLGLPGANPMG